MFGRKDPTKCMKGLHEWAPDNLTSGNGCRACKKLANRAWELRRRRGLGPTNVVRNRLDEFFELREMGITTHQAVTMLQVRPGTLERSMERYGVRIPADLKVLSRLERRAREAALRQA